MLVQRRQDSCLVARDTSGFSARFARAIGSHLEVRQETQLPFQFPQGYFYSYQFSKGSGIISFEALNSTCLLNCQRDMRAPVEMKCGTRAFSRVSTGDSDIPSSWGMIDEPAFKSLQGNPALFQIRATRRPFHLRT